MQARELKQKLKLNDILQLMEHLGADHMPIGEGNEIYFRTVCHNGNSHKLCLYKDTLQFHCYTHCGQLDIINVFQNVYEVKTDVAIDIICGILKISGNFKMEIGFNQGESCGPLDRDYEYLNKYSEKAEPVDMSRDFKLIDESILRRFRVLYHPAFYEDGISPSTMDKFGILYDVLNYRIIIPHRDEMGRLIGIRCRNLDERLINLKLKYTPIKYRGKFLSAKTGKYLYGLDKNKDHIVRIKKVILFESEKAVMQLDSMLNSNNFSVALCGSALSMIQVELLKQLGVEEVIIALDKEYDEYNTKLEKLYAMKVRKSMINKLLPDFVVSVIWDTENLLDKKDSPTDKGWEIFKKLYDNRIFIKE